MMLQEEPKANEISNDPPKSIQYIGNVCKVAEIINGIYSIVKGAISVN